MLLTLLLNEVFPIPTPLTSTKEEIELVNAYAVQLERELLDP